MSEPAREVTDGLRDVRPGQALDLACGGGRHSVWLAQRGWTVTAVDQAVEPIPGVECIVADLELHGFTIEPAAWDLIVCWLYWQPDLMPSIAAGIREGGMAALAGKTTGRFATSLVKYREAFAGWTELVSGEDPHRVFWIGRKNSS